MHELSVALEICRIAEERLGTFAPASLVAVGVEVGDDAGLEPANLQFCLDALLAQPPFGRGAATLALVRGDVLRVSYVEVDDDSPDDRGP